VGHPQGLAEASLRVLSDESWTRVHLWRISGNAGREKWPHLSDVVNHVFIRYGTEREIHALKMVEDFQPVAILLFFLAVMPGMSWGIFKIAPGRKLNE
jgi:hypothetical protein